jgi:ABC-type antimicrobial peptide transport system permease subunit
MSQGASSERIREAWAEIRENPGRTTLQALAVILGVASVLGGFAISDSMRHRSMQMYVKGGGLDKLEVQPLPQAKGTQPSALQSANLGLRQVDATGGAALDPEAVAGVSVRRFDQAMVRSTFTAQHRQVTGIGGDFIAMAGYSMERGRAFALAELESGAPVAILGSEAAHTFFPSGDALGRTLVLGGIPVTVVGTFRVQEFRFAEGERNIFSWQNRIIALPAVFVQKRLQAEFHGRLDYLTFRVPKPDDLRHFSLDLAALLRSNHRSQTDFRLDDVAGRMRRFERQGRIYDLIFLLSGFLALLGGGIVNVNIQLASLRERVREVGLKMALGASGREVFLGFMTEAMLLTGLGAAAGLAVGIGFSWAITRSLEVPLHLHPMSFLWAFLLAAGFGFVFALFPAWKASRLSPMEALRYE